MINPKQREDYYKSLRPLPYKETVYSTHTDRDDAYLVNSASAVDGVIEFTQDSMVGRGCTGMVYRLGSPTGYYSDRWDRQYAVGDTGCLSYSGSTGYQGTYQIEYTFDVSGVTGVAHDQYYGIQFEINKGAAEAPVTGLHMTTQTVFHVHDTIG